MSTHTSRGEDGNQMSAKLEINIHSSLFNMMMEVKYFNLLGKNIPVSAKRMLEKAGKLNTYLGVLEVIVSKYNNLCEMVLAEEMALMEKDFQQIDSLIERGLGEITWDSEGVREYLNQLLDVVGDLHSRSNRAKTNLRDIQTTLASWHREPLVHANNEAVDLKVAHKKVLGKPKQISEDGERIKQLVFETGKILQADQDSEAWKTYLDYIDSLVGSALGRMATTSLGYFLSRISNQNWRPSRDNPKPLVQISLALKDSEIRFQPPLGLGDANLPCSDTTSKDELSILGFFRDLVNLFNTIGSSLNRFSSEGNYTDIVKLGGQTAAMGMKLISLVERKLTECDSYREKYFDDFSFLWIQNRENFLKAFQRYGEILPRHHDQTFAPHTRMLLTLHLDFDHQNKKFKHPQSCITPVGHRTLELVMEGVDIDSFMEQEEKRRAMLSNTVAGVEEAEDTGNAGDPTTLEDYDEIISEFETCSQQVSTLENEIPMEWLMLNSRKLRIDLIKLVAKWTYLFTSDLQSRLNQNLLEVREFVNRFRALFSIRVQVNDMSALKSLQSAIADFYQKNPRVESLFTPMRGTMSILKKHGTDIPEQVISELSQLPREFFKLQNKCGRIQNLIQPILSRSALTIFTKVLDFTTEEE